MKIGILSDSHDNIWALDEALDAMKDVDTVIHCGDLIAPFIIKRLAAVFAVPVHVVWGNNDGDKRLLTSFAEEAGNIVIHGELAELEIDGLNIAVNHYPEIARPLAESGRYDLVCYGHDHTAHEEQLGDTLLLNPGEIMGLNGRRTCAIYDTEEQSVEWVELG